MLGKLANAFRNFNHTCRGYRQQLETEPMGDFEQLQADATELHAENQRLRAENAAAWDAVADLADHLTAEQIGAELKRKGIDTAEAFARLRAALRAKKGG